MNCLAKIVMVVGLALPPTALLGQAAENDRAESQNDAESPEQAHFLFSYFRGNGEDGLHLAHSSDGWTWTALNEDKPFLRSEIGSKLMRDPCILRGPDGTYHLVWTSGWNDSMMFGYAASKDLLAWSEPQAVTVMEDEPRCRNVWAPELFYDDVKQQFLIFWASTIPGKFPDSDPSGDQGYNHRIYYITTADFKTFSRSKLFYDGGFNVIDATMIKVPGQYILIVKDETLKPVKKNLRIATGASPEGPWCPAGEPFTISWVEGPSALRIGDQYVVYFDHYRQPQRYGAVVSKDLAIWKDVTHEMSFPQGCRHGTMIRVERSVVDRLQAVRADPASGAD